MGAAVGAGMLAMEKGFMCEGLAMVGLEGGEVSG